jgi:hypothetical protein
LPDVYVGAYGATPEDALHKAAGLASSLDSTLKEHPALAALIPPQATLALKAISAASGLLADGGSLKQVVNKVGPAAASVVHSILSLF